MNNEKKKKGNVKLEKFFYLISYTNPTVLHFNLASLTHSLFEF